MSFGRTPWLTLLTVVPLLTNTVRAESSREVNVFSYLTDDGRKIATPTPASPAYYLLINGGYQEMGDLVKGEKSPDAARVEKLVRKALAVNGYQGVTKTSPHLDLVVTFHWGYANPQIEKDDSGNETFYNLNQMYSLVGGRALSKADLNFERAAITEAAREDRYFVIVTAFDFNAYMKQKKRIMLWRTQMSVPSVGIDQDTALPALVSAGGALMGRETNLPKQIFSDLGRQGEVEIGTATVEEYIPSVTLPKSSEKLDLGRSGATPSQKTKSEK